MSEELLELALTLAYGLSAGRPKSAELRRTASSAYYALFHAICFLRADQLVGKNSQSRFFTPMYRAVDHRAARTVLTDIRRTDPGSALATIAVTFSQLQDVRHDADYNPEPFRFNRNGTSDLVEAGRQAISLLTTFKPEQKLMLPVRLIGRPR